MGIIFDLLLTILRYSFLFILLFFVFFIYRLIYFDLNKKPLNAKTPKNGFSLLVLNSGESKDIFKNQMFPLLKNEIIIGRESDVDIFINLPVISSHHALLSNVNNSIYIEDLKSTNGTYVNGKLIRDRVKLEVNDIIIIGNVNLKLVGCKNESCYTN